MRPAAIAAKGTFEVWLVKALQAFPILRRRLASIENVPRNETRKKVPKKTMPGWIIRVLGRVSQWGSYVTKRAPTVTPEIAAGTSRPPHLFKSDKAMKELGYEAVPLETMLGESYEWLKGEGLV